MNVIFLYWIVFLKAFWFDQIEAMMYFFGFQFCQISFSFCLQGAMANNGIKYESLNMFSFQHILESLISWLSLEINLIKSKHFWWKRNCFFRNLHFRWWWNLNELTGLGLNRHALKSERWVGMQKILVTLVQSPNVRTLFHYP